ncbi:putative 1-aminocyclopropane-1-carboxylate oxidase [Lasiosphaeria ovina]|uniref:1-aminocyclopropane-1-carboxylate oxidase n=1 Tax=Lasiosphaeria ovina TaxID=92902 RepID=A0AAE0N537_9PEZI|nr:putative 1-aminocyclopropane-1-carboxylate oxidase [Lasiosphaeria ovina]
MAGIDGDFTSISALDISLASSPSTKAQFLSEMRNALLEVATVHSKHFLGYNSMGAESTSARTEHNESIAWPDEAALPHFRKTIETYRLEIQSLAADFTLLIKQSLGLPPTTLTRFLNNSPFNRFKITSYFPPPPSPSTDINPNQQGVGAHKDSVFMTYLLQAGEHNCLEVQNKSGAWILVPPILGT